MDLEHKVSSLWYLKKKIKKKISNQNVTLVEEERRKNTVV